MKKFLLLSILLVTFIQESTSQKSSKNNYEGKWSTNTSWTDNVAPGFTIVNNIDYIINGYITVGEYTVDNSLDQGLNFPDTGEDDFFTVRDTLVVYGDVSIANKGHRIVIEAEGLFIVFGNYSANNKIDVSNGGKLIVTGATSISGGQSEYSGTGELYALGGFSGNNSDAQSAANNSDFSTEPESLRNFINTRGGNGPLPIELKSFTAKVNNSSVQLDWVTAKEENFSHFEVERSVDMEDFEMIGLVQGQGESLSDVYYDLNDSDVPFGKIYYRLKAVDIDDTFEYSPVVEVENGFNGQVSVYPNPAEQSGRMKIKLPTAFKGNVNHIAIYDLQGSKMQEFFSYDPDKELSIDNQIKAGLYLLKIQHNGIEENIRVLIK